MKLPKKNLRNMTWGVFKPYAFFIVCLFVDFLDETDIVHTYKGLWKGCYRKTMDTVTSCYAVSQVLSHAELQVACEYIGGHRVM